jgi:hypothetical protein
MFIQRAMEEWTKDMLKYKENITKKRTEKVKKSI